MWRKIVAMALALSLPAAASAGPLREAAAKAAREQATAQQREAPTRSRARFWTGIALIAGGTALAVLGGLELGDDEMGPDDGEDADDSDDGEDSDGWGQGASLGAGIAAAGVGGVLLLTGRKRSGPEASIKPASLTLSHTVRF